MKNEILIFGEIPFEQNAANSALWVRNRLARMDFSTNKELTVKINSEGGDVDNGFAIYNALREVSESGVKVITEISGRCASIATIIFLAGDYRIGNKYFSPFVHSASISGSINQHDAAAAVMELKAVDNRIAELYADVTKGTKSQYLEMMKKETSIDANTALELRFFHEIKRISKPKNMTFLNTIKNKLSPLFGVKNLKIYTADQREVEIDTEATMYSVGDSVKIDGQTPENGELLLENGVTIVIADGVIEEIIPAEPAAPENKEDEPTDDQKAMNEIAEGMVALNNKFEELTNKNASLESENAELKSSIEIITNKLEDADRAINAFKNLKGQSVDDKKNTEPEKTSALDKYRK